MKKELYGSIDLKQQMKCKQPVIVEYFITEQEDGDRGYDKNKPFGIEVIKKQTIDGIIYREIKTVNHISENADRVNSLLNILHRNGVTPICVSDVLEDFKAI
ncbi:MAG: hypothetical protein IJQ50_06090 [Clostridia bacterium]|nr:hypothetical protein [Clostridia bacterium]